MLNKSNYGFYTFLILGLTLDRIFKILSQFYFLSEQSNWFGSYSLNQVAAWSWPISNQFLIWFNAIVLLGLFFIYLNFSSKKSWLSYALILIIAGAYSNLYDRWFYGGVIDYWNVFNLINLNLADIFISCGCLLWLKYLLFTKTN